MIKVLFLASNPLDSVRLRQGAEVREIDEALQKGKFRSAFDLVQQSAVRSTDLQSHLLRYEPQIVHFSGHGTLASEIMLEDSSGTSRPVPLEALERLFALLGKGIRCVVLNACYSEPQAKAIAKHVPSVIGMSNAIADEAAIAFAKAFYQALGYGKDIQTAYQLGCVQIALDDLAGFETLQLIALGGRADRTSLATSIQPPGKGSADDAAILEDRTGIEIYCKKPWSRLGPSPNCAITRLEPLQETKRKLMWEAFVFIPLEPNANYRLTISRPADPISFKATIDLSIAPGGVGRYLYESPPISFMAGTIKPMTGQAAS